MKRVARDGAVCLGVTMAFAVFAWTRGQDANWDWQNYHAYAAYAFLTGRDALNVAPGGYQGFLNPLPYLLPFLLRQHMAPQVAAGLLGAVQAVPLWLVWLLTGRLMPGRTVLRLLALVLAATGAVTLSEIGTSFADLLLSAPILWALLLLLGEPFGVDRPPSVFVCALAGLLAGAAMGLKLTGIVFAPGLALAVLVWGISLPRLLALAGGGLAGSLSTGGWLAWQLWREYGNPIFPEMNDIFRSPQTVASSFADPRFRPGSWSEALLAPWEWAAGSHPWAETPMRDARVALLLLLLALLAVTTMIRWKSVSGSRQLIAAIVFFVSSYVIWLTGFGIARYAECLELLASVLIVAVTAKLVPRQAPVALVVIATMAWTQPGDWWHRPWSNTYHGPVLPEALTRPASFLTSEAPMGYLVSYFPSEARFYRLSPVFLVEGGRFRSQLLAGMHHPPAGGGWLMTYDLPLPPETRTQLAALGLALVPECWHFESLWFVATRACRLRDTNGVTEPVAGLGTHFDFSTGGSGWVTEDQNWAAADADGTWALGSQSALVFHLAGDAAGAAIRLRLLSLPVTHDALVIAEVDAKEAKRWHFRPGEGSSDQLICLPPQGDTDVRIVFHSPDAISPQALGINQDPRAFGFKLSGADIVSDASCASR